ncbi:MAG: hypothetical protein ABJF05_07830 [Paracoccaceae bacterium]
MSEAGMKPEDLGFSDCMGPELREFVEGQLLDDLEPYLQSAERLISKVFASIGQTVALKGTELIGWMKFIETEVGLVVFWWYLRGSEAYYFQSKNSNGVPKHIWEKLSTEVRTNWSRYAPDERRLP